MTLKNYLVQIPLVGFVTIEVKAEGKDDAIEKAFQTTVVEIDMKKSNVLDIEFELVSQITRGNVLNAPMNSVDCEEV